MAKDERNQYQIIRKDAKNCFVESLSNCFPIGKAHFGFATYDLKRPEGSRQTNNIQIYVSISEIMELCQKLTNGVMRQILQEKKSSNDSRPIQEWLGGTSADKLRAMGKARPDGKSLSRTCKLMVSNRGGFLLIADSGPGDQDEKGLIVPKFGSKPENHVVIPLSWEDFAELILLTEAHYNAWLSAAYVMLNLSQSGNHAGFSNQPAQTENYAAQEGYGNQYGSDNTAQAMF